MKFGADRDDVFLAKSGFGGAEYLLAGHGHRGPAPRAAAGRRGPADRDQPGPSLRAGRPPRAPSAVGLDADIALVDLDRSWTVRAADSVSAQEYSPLEGFEMTAP